jgi:hypothetical protein
MLIRIHIEKLNHLKRSKRLEHQGRVRRWVS